MKSKIYIYGLCNIFYDGFYIQGINEIYQDFEFNISKFPKFNQGTFAFIIENENYSKKIIIDSKDSAQINSSEFEWCDLYGKVNYNLNHLPVENSEKVIAIGPSFGIRIWSLFKTLYYLILNFMRFRNSISNKREFIANYWRQYKRLELDEYNPVSSSSNEVFFINSIWKQENETNRNRALFIKSCKSNSNIIFEGGFAARSNGDNLGYDDLVYSNKIPLKTYMKKIQNSAFVFSTPAVLSCHGWKLAEFLALGKAIITTPHFNILPKDLSNNIEVIYVNDGGDIKNAIEKITKNFDFKRGLELASKNYFDQYLAPKKVIIRLLENI